MALFEVSKKMMQGVGSSFVLFIFLILPFQAGVALPCVFVRLWFVDPPNPASHARASPCVLSAPNHPQQHWHDQCVLQPCTVVMERVPYIVS